MYQGDKARHHPKRTAATEARNKILGETLTEDWVLPKQGHNWCC